jgi:hypothetical protein
MAKKYALDLDDTLHAGWVRAPGDGFFDVNPWLHHKGGAILLEPEPVFWEWVEGSMYDEPRDAAIVAFDDEGREVERLILKQATVAEVGMPALDAVEAGALWIRIEAAAVDIRDSSASASSRGDAPAIVGCRVQLHGPEAPPQRVNKIDALTITLGRRGLQRVALTVEGEADWTAAEALIDRQGALEYLAADTESVLARVEFKIAGIDVEATETERAKLVLACRGLRVAPGGNEGGNEGGGGS